MTERNKFAVLKKKNDIRPTGNLKSSRMQDNNLYNKEKAQSICCWTTSHCNAWEEVETKRKRKKKKGKKKDSKKERERERKNERAL